jgi:hypothetical protein
VSLHPYFDQRDIAVFRYLKEWPGVPVTLVAIAVIGAATFCVVAGVF